MEENNQLDSTPWYAIRLFSLKLNAASGYFEEKTVEYWWNSSKTRILRWLF